MAATYDLHPEFGYFCPSPAFRRKERAVLVFAAFGLFAAASGIAALVARTYPNVSSDLTIRASALEIIDKQAVETGQARGDVVHSEGAAKPCLELKYFAENCPGNARKPRFVRGLTDRPAVAAAPIGRIDRFASEPAATAPIASRPDPSMSDAIPTLASSPADAAPASIPPLPRTVAAAKKSQKTTRSHVRRRDPYHEPSWRGYDYRGTGYARGVPGRCSGETAPRSHAQRPLRPGARSRRCSAF